MTMSASVGKVGVVRCPNRILEGSRCQKDFVELGVGKLAWPGDEVVPVIIWVGFGDYNVVVITSDILEDGRRTCRVDLPVGGTKDMMLL